MSHPLALQPSALLSLEGIGRVVVQANEESRYEFRDISTVTSGRTDSTGKEAVITRVRK